MKNDKKVVYSVDTCPYVTLKIDDSNIDILKEFAPFINEDKSNERVTLQIDGIFQGKIIITEKNQNFFTHPINLSYDQLEQIINTSYTAGNIHKDKEILDLSKADLSNMKFVNIAFEKININEADMSDSIFRKCDLSNKQIDGVDFTKTTFKSITFKNSSLRGSDFSNVTFKDVDFTGANLSKIVFDNISLKNTTGLESIQTKRAKGVVSESNSQLPPLIINNCELPESLQSFRQRELNIEIRYGK